MRPIFRPMAVLIILCLTILLLFPPGIKGDQPPTRTPILYSGSVNGVGDSGDLCLAGHKWYNVSFTFLDISIDDVNGCGVFLKAGIESRTLFDWNLTTPGVATTILIDELSIRNPGLFTDRVNVTFHFDAFFHMAWTYEREITLLPKLVMNETQQDLDALTPLQIGIHGTIEPYDILVETLGEESVEETEQVKANSTVIFKEIKFRYWHLTETVSMYSPKSSEMEVVLNDGVSTFNATWETGGFRADILVPDFLDERIDIRMDITGLQEDWKIKVQQWKYSLAIDGLSPDISLRYPATKEDNIDFDWEITITERPRNKMDVDGSSIKYRVFSFDEWGPWIALPLIPDDRVIVATGSATGQKGSGNTSLQFMASDELGNVNISSIFQVDINQGPKAMVPVDVDGKEFFQNETIDIDGGTMVIDHDDGMGEMDFKWFIDDDITPFSTLSEFNKSLFNMNPGEHTVRMLVSDGSEEDEVTFSFIVKEVPKPEEDTDIMEILTDPTFLTIAIPILIMALIIIIVVVIIIISKKLRRTDDFIINEDTSLSGAQADEMAKRIRDLYDDVAAQHAATENDAQIDLDDGKFDFDYNLYEVLGLDQNATDVEIKKKYRKMAAFYHPDRVAHHSEIDPNEAAEEMVRINKTKEILLDPEFKADYDSYNSDMDFSMDLESETVDDEDDDDDEEVDDVWA